MDLGAALRRANRRAEAREELAAGMELAHRCGADALAARAREELVACGARPRRLVRTGVDALTPSELRVAQLAAAGHSNREIAQALFVTRKTVETHLGGIYRKLGVNAREHLAGKLQDPPPDAKPARGPGGCRTMTATHGPAHTRPRARGARRLVARTSSSPTSTSGCAR